MLAALTNIPESEIKECLPAVMFFYDTTLEGFIFSPELEMYRKYQEDRKARMIAGGKRGAASTNRKNNRDKSRTDKRDTTTQSATPPDMLRPLRRGNSGPLVESRTVKPSQVQSVGKEVSTDQWLTEYEAADERGKLEALCDDLPEANKTAAVVTGISVGIGKRADSYEESYVDQYRKASKGE